MLQNDRVTTFTVSELLRENQQGVKLRPHIQIKVKCQPILLSFVLANIVNNLY